MHIAFPWRLFKDWAWFRGGQASGDTAQHDASAVNSRSNTSLPPSREITVNGVTVEVQADACTTLLEVIRNHCKLTGAKFACGDGACGACTVLESGQPVLSCVRPVAFVEGPVETVEALAEEFIHLRECFADRGAFQCGFCTPGFLVVAASVLRGPSPSVEAFRAAASANICRCTGYQPILEGFRDALDRHEAECGEPSPQSQ